MLDFDQDSAAIALFSKTSPGLKNRLRVLFSALEGVNPDQQAYERTIRETIAMGDEPLTTAEADELLNLTIRMLHQEETRDDLVLPCFCGTFEWFNRQEKDQTRRMAGWDTIMRAAGRRFEGISIYHYVRSRYFLDKGHQDEALDNASAAVDIAPLHVGYLNNYSEIVLDVVENELLAGNQEVLTRENSRGEDIELMIERFDSLMSGSQSIYPSFYLTRGRLCACVQRFDEAEWDFARARELIVKMHDEGDPRFSNEGDYIIEIGKVINAQSTTAVLKSSFTAWASLEEARWEQERKSQELLEKMEEVYQRLDDERVNLLEFLGFFSGIISFIIASIQVGSDMDFVARASLLVIMLGTLLIAFGSLGYLIERTRSSSAEAAGKKRLSTTVAAKSKVMLLVGIGTVVFGFVIYLVLRLAGA